VAAAMQRCAVSAAAAGTKGAFWHFRAPEQANSTPMLTSE